MYLPDKETVRKQWLDQYASEQDALNAIRHEALRSLTPPAAKRNLFKISRQWVLAHRVFCSSVAAAWAIAIVLNLTAPDITAPNVPANSISHLNRSVEERRFTLGMLAAQQHELMQWFEADLEATPSLEKTKARKISPAKEPQAFLRHNNTPRSLSPA